MKNIYFVILMVVLGLYVVNEVRKKRFSIKESFFWIIGVLVMLLLSIFPKSIDNIAKFLGISYAPSLLFVICIIFLLAMLFRDSKRITELQIKIVDLEQNLTIVKGNINK